MQRPVRTREMSDSGLNFKGRPNTDQVETMRILYYCGGQGGGGCLPTMGVPGIVLPYRVPKYITYNRKIVFHNNEFFGLRIFEDGGPVGLCSHSIGSNEIPFYMALAADPNLDIKTVAETGQLLSGPLGYDVEFDAPDCPQPTDPAWENIVYVYLWWGSAGYVGEGGPARVGDFTLVKHDKDSRI